MTEVRVWISDLAAYNAGVLRGKWWDPTEYSDADDFGTAVQEWIEGTEDAPDVEDVGERGVYYIPEEYAIHDYEAPSGIRIKEYTSLDTVWGLANAIAEHGEAYADYVSNVGQECATVEGFEERYVGHYDNGANYVYEMYEDSFEIKVDRWGDPVARQLASTLEAVQSYIDWDDMWRTWTHDGYWISNNGHLFRP